MHTLCRHAIVLLQNNLQYFFYVIPNFVAASVDLNCVCLCGWVYIIKLLIQWACLAFAVLPRYCNRRFIFDDVQVSLIFSLDIDTLGLVERYGNWTIGFINYAAFILILATYWRHTALQVTGLIRSLYVIRRNHLFWILTL